MIMRKGVPLNNKILMYPLLKSIKDFFVKMKTNFE